MFRLPAGYKNVEGDDRLRIVLDLWLRMYYQGQLKGFTHARADRIDGGRVRWKLLDADDNGVRREQDISLGEGAEEAANEIVQPFLFEASPLSPINRWRLTFRFDPPAVGLDGFRGDDNEAAVAKYLIDLDAERRVQEELLKSL